MEKRTVYADHAATSPVSKPALDAMLPYLTSSFGNPSSIHHPGMNAARAVLSARKTVADALGSDFREIYFTSGGSESDNWAIFGAAELGAAQNKKHIVTTAVEHSAVLESCRRLESRGFEVTYVRPDAFGFVSAESVISALRPDTCLASVMHANNETGVIMPVSDIGRACRERGVLFHTDAVQTVGHIPVNVGEICCDLLSLSGHKLGAPKGVGVLYIRSGLRLPPLIFGGGQERGIRAGTENVPAIAALAAAITSSCAEMQQNAPRISALRDKLESALLTIENSRLNGAADRLPGHLNISFPGIEGESMVLLLDMHGIYVSSGSACAAGSTEPSHVLTAMGLTEREAKSGLRFTLGSETTPQDIDYMISAVTASVARLREMTPKK